MVFIFKKLTIQGGGDKQVLGCYNKDLPKALGSVQEGTQLSMDMKAVSLKRSCLSQVLKEPGNYRTGGHWWPREESLFQTVG